MGDSQKNVSTGLKNIKLLFSINKKIKNTAQSVQFLRTTRFIRVRKFDIFEYTSLENCELHSQWCVFLSDTIKKPMLVVQII